MADENIVLSLAHITKIFPGVTALDDVSVSFRKGEVHALLGENGAGKSTLIKTITGYHAPDGGTITVNGETFSALKPSEARERGIEAIYQEHNLIGGLSSAENICLGTKYGRFVDYKKMNEVATELFDRFHIEINPKTLVRNLSSAQMQIVEIAKAVSKGAKILIMDEPTAPLSVAEVDILMNMIRQLKSEGCTIIYISHRLNEIFEICDRVTVFRDGKYIVTRNVADTDRAQLIKDMVGRELNETYPQRKTEPGETALEVKNLTGNGVKNISFSVRKGEILGIAGLVGAGRSEIMKVLYGAEKRQWGRVFVNGELAKIKSPKDALRYGMGYVPEDRKREGCFLTYGVGWNIVIGCIKRVSRNLFVNEKKANEVANSYVKRIKVKAPNLGTKVITLSGGNQQKIVVSKTLAAQTDILIFDEPTRGIDVGAKHEIYELMNDLCAEGKAVIMVSSDMEELLGMSDRIVVLHEHELAGEVTKDKFTQEYILMLASGETGEEEAV